MSMLFDFPAFISAFQQFMRGSLFYILLANFALVCIFFVISRKDITARFGKIGKRAWIVFVIILIMGSSLRFNSPGCSDSAGLCFNYVETAKEMLKTQHVSDLWHPKAYSLLMAIGFFFFGQNYNVVYFFNLMISSLTIFLVFLLAYVLFKREDAALFSTLIYSLFPMSIIYAKLNESQTTSTFFLVLTIIVYLISLSANKRNIYTLFFLLMVFSLHARTDVSIFIPLFVLGFILNRKDISMKELKIPVVIFLMLMIPASYYYVFGAKLYGPSESHPYSERHYFASLEYMLPNVQRLLSDNLIAPDFYPIVLYIFLLFSLLFFVKERGVAYMVVLAASFFLLYGVWWRTIYGDMKPYELGLQPTLAILMGYGISRAKECMGNATKNRFLLKTTTVVKYAELLVTLFLIALVFHVSTNVFALEVHQKCLIENILYLGNRHIGDNDCLLFENVPPPSDKYFPVNTMEILLHNNYLATSLSGCGNRKAYYLYVNQTKDCLRFFGTGQPLFTSLESNYAINVVEKKGCVILYEVGGVNS